MASKKPRAQEKRATFIKMEVPKTLIVGEAGLARLTVRNDGDTTWTSSPWCK